MTKEEKIKEAWIEQIGEERYNSLKEEFVMDGWLHSPPIALERFETKFIDAGLFYRPRSLQGIENNNGWIKIESEEQIKDFQNEFCWVIVKTGELEKMYIHSSNKNFVLNMCTHYQLIEKPKSPIY